MYIGQNEIRDSVDLSSNLNLAHKKFYDLEASGLLTHVWLSVDTIWKSPDLKNYTKHNLDHSGKIISYFLKVDELFKWSDYEKLIFSIAALIHDIGMQYNEWGPHEGFPDKGIPKPPLEPTDIRNYHVDIGYEFFMKYIIIKDSFPEVPPLCDFNSYGQRNAIYYAGYIASAHSGKRYIEDIKNDRTFDTRDDFEEGVFRPRLLAALLRLFDELDNNYHRIFQPNLIHSWKIDETTKSHWLACLFVENTKLIIEGKNLKIIIDWWVPPNTDKVRTSKIYEMIRSMREGKIRNEISFINQFLTDCKEPKPYDVISIEPLDPTPRTCGLFNFNESLDQAIDLAITKKNNVIGLSTVERPNEINPDDTKKEADSFKTSIKNGGKLHRKQKLEDELKEWFNKNKESGGHYILVNNNEHTDTYLKCRSLVSNQHLLLHVASRIFKSYKNKNIKCILAVGTSAIPLAVNLALRFNCSVTFTVSSVKNDPNNPSEPKSYHPMEIIPLITDCDTLLIIDDVISGGSVVKNILDLVSTIIRLPATIYHHAIFRLGDRKYDSDIRIKKYSYILHIPDVNYYIDEKTCPLCKAGIIPCYEKYMI